MLFALMSLAALSLAAIALVRSVDTGTLIMGNLSFKEDSLLGSEEATRVAIASISTAGALAGADKGYFDTMPKDLDVTGGRNLATRTLIDWKLDGCAEHKTGTYAKCMKPADTKVALPNGVWARYIIVRLCASSGAAADCLGPVNQTATSESTERGEIKRTEDYRPTGLTAGSFYQIIVRTEGTRDTVSYTETLTHSY